jgi:triosephosphate isomerase
MRLPLILVNFKTYLEALGENAIKLAKICESVSKEYKANIAIAPQFFDLSNIVKKVRIPVLAQHIDPIEKNGMHTGNILAENLKKIGVVGTLISHSERRLKLKEIEKCIEVAKKFDLISIVCSEDPKKSRKIAKFNPDFIAIEPPELIGTGISVSKAKPEIITKSIKKIHDVNPKVKVLCGAGITTGEDVERALKLGTVGILVASGVVKAKNPKKVLIEFAKAIKQTS